MKRNKIGSIVLGALLLSVLVVPRSQVKAATHNESNLVTIDINSITNANDITVSEPMTYSELTEYMTEALDISEQEAIQRIGTPIPSKLRATPTYRVLGAYLDVSSSYRPTLNFYCQTSEDGSYWGIVAITDVYMDRANSYGDGQTKTFCGDTYIRLDNAYTITYRVTGDFYNNSTTTVSGGLGGAIKIGESFTLSMSGSISSSSSHYAYYNSGYVTKQFQW